MSVERVRWLREQGSRLARMSESMFEQANLVEREMDDRPIVKGGALADLVVTVLMSEGDGMHYRDILARVEDQFERRVRGVDPAATLLATIHRDPRIVPAHPRSGVWTLAEAASSTGETGT